MPLAFKNDAMGWAQLDTGEGQLALQRVDPSDAEGRALVGRFVGVSLEVPDVLATYERLSADARAHEALHELALEEQEADEERPRGHEGRRGDDGPVHALIARGEDLQAHGQWA